MTMFVTVCVLALLSIFGNASAIRNYYMDVNCGSTIDFTMLGLDAIRLRMTSRSSYQRNMDCSLTLSADYLSRMMIQFKSIAIEGSSYSCNNDYLEVRDGSSRTSSYVNGLYGKQCGTYISSTVHTTSDNNMYLHFVSDDSLQYKGFDMIITQYHTGLCYSFEYNCNNGRCIDDSVKCNGFNPCGDYSDCPMAAGAIAGIVISGIFCFTFVVVVLIVCARRRARRIAYGQPTHVPVVSTVTSYGSSQNAGYGQPVPTAYPPPYTPGPQYPQPAGGQQYPQPAGQQYPQPAGQPYPTGQTYPTQ